MISVEEVEKAEATREMASARVGALEAGIKLNAAAIDETEATIREMPNKEVSTEHAGEQPAIAPHLAAD